MESNDHGLLLQAGQKDSLLTESMVRYVASSPEQMFLDLVLTPSGLIARIILASPTPKEIEAVSSEKAMLYAMNHRGLLVGILDLGEGFQLEFNYNAFPLTAEDWDHCREMSTCEMFGSLSLCMTDLVSGNIVALRYCTLSRSMTHYIYKTLLDQEPTKGLDPLFARSLLDDVWKTYPDLSSMRKIMPVHCRLGSKAG